MVTEKAAALVSELEQIAHAFFSVKRLDVAIEKYSHGGPDVVITLQQNADHLERNIQLVVDDEGNRVAFFANVWRDDRYALERHWVCKDFAQPVGSLSERELVVVITLVLERMVNTIKSVKESDLLFTSRL